jgi:hypothetical protein
MRSLVPVDVEVVTQPFPRRPQNFKPSAGFWVTTTSVAAVAGIGLYVVLVHFAPHWGLRQNYQGVTNREYVSAIVAALVFVAAAVLWVRITAHRDG